MEKIDKLDIAKEMLEAAIEEYLDQERYFVAYNLAGVAEEILGKLVRLQGEKDALTQTVDNVKLVNRKLGGDEIPDKKWKKLISNLKNSIKHMNSGNDRHIETNIYDEARRKINDAVKNYDALNIGTTTNIERYYKWWRDTMRHNSSFTTDT